MTQCQHPCLIPIRSQQVKICADCKERIPWELGDRKPVGWSVDAERVQKRITNPVKTPKN